MPYKDKEKQREAQARYARENRAALNATQNSKRNMMRRYIQKVKDVPCHDCKESFPYYMMDFDHLPGTIKYASIGMELSKLGSMKALMDEISKCEIVCANCHRHRTFMRQVKVAPA